MPAMRRVKKDRSDSIVVFISYAMEDSKEAGSLHRLLATLGFDCFLAHKDIRKGERWRDAILRELRASDAFVVLLSEHGVGSCWVQQESGMAHLLHCGNRRPLIIPVVPKGELPPGCLSEYQAQEIGLTFWLSKLDVGSSVAGNVARTMIDHLDCLPLVKPKAISNLKSAAIEDFAFVLTFLVNCGNVAFSEFLTILNHSITHPKVAITDAVMTQLYALLEVHRSELDKLPDWVKAWNRLHQRYVEHKEAVRRQQEEMLRSMQRAMRKSEESNKSV